MPLPCALPALLLATLSSARAQDGWMSVEPREPVGLVGCYDEPGATREDEQAVVTFQSLRDQRIVRVFPDQGPDWILVLLDPRMDKEHRALDPGETDEVKFVANCRESMREEIEGAWNGLDSCPAPFVVGVEVDGTQVERHEVEVCIFCNHGQIEIPERDGITLVGTDGCPATGTFEVSNVAASCALRRVAVTGPDGFTIEPASFTVPAMGVEPFTRSDTTRTVQLTAPCRDQPPLRTERLVVTSSDLDAADASIEIPVTVQCGPPTTEIAVGRYPHRVQARAPRRDFQFSVVAGDPTPPLTLDFRGAPGCAPERWFECGEGTIHDATIPASAPGPLYQVPFLACYGKGEGPGTEVRVAGRAVLVDAEKCESKPVEFVYTCQY